MVKPLTEFALLLILRATLTAVTGVRVNTSHLRDQSEIILEGRDEREVILSSVSESPLNLDIL